MSRKAKLLGFNDALLLNGLLITNPCEIIHVNNNCTP